MRELGVSHEEALSDFDFATSITDTKYRNVGTHPYVCIKQMALTLQHILQHRRNKDATHETRARRTVSITNGF